MTQSIGTIICNLRKTRGITQEELGSAVGVSAQAVSKWECGGVPDVELLPRIADYFGISLDTLFERDHTDYTSNLYGVYADIAQIKDGAERFRRAYEVCVGLNMAMEWGKGANEIQEGLEKLLQWRNDYDFHSQIITDDGMAIADLSCDMPYYFLAPQTDARMPKILGDDLRELFAHLGDTDFWNAVVLIFQRDSSKRFTGSLLVKQLGMSPEKAETCLSVMNEYGMIERTETEVDDTVLASYAPQPCPALAGVLQLGYSLRHRVTCYNYTTLGRRKPYLQ